MAYNFKDKVVLVTCAARGLGKEITKRFLESGAIVIFTDIDDEEAKNVTQEIIKLGRVVYMHMDNTIEDEVKAKIAAIIKQLENWIAQLIFQHLFLQINHYTKLRVVKRKKKLMLI